MRYSVFRRLGAAVALAILMVLISKARGQDLATYEKQMREISLDNGLKFLVLERHVAPVVAFHVHADVGAVNEVRGLTGLAHLLEHMAFKGTKTIGTKDYAAEAPCLAAMDELFAALQTELRQGEHANPERVTELRRRFKDSEQQAQKLIAPNEFPQAFQRAGATNLNASTSYDYTMYHVSLPSNKIELWMLLESDRFLHPVLREFYKEKEVVMEERRTRTENDLLGCLAEEFLAVAYKVHPYGNPPVGHMSDLERITRADAEEFLARYYVPGNMTIALVGDVCPDRVEELARAYFGRIPYHVPPAPVTAVEPAQRGERRVAVEGSAQPVVLVGYHRPSMNHEDDAVFDVIVDIMGTGRTARLYKSLVKDKKIAMAASVFQGRPGYRYPGMIVFHAVPAKDHTNDECEKALEMETDRLKHTLIADEELDKAKTRARAALIWQLDSNAGLAGRLAFYQAVTGNWRNLFKHLEGIEAVTAQDIQRVANSCFARKNRTVGMIETTEGIK